MSHVRSALVAAAATLCATPALAADETDWSLGIASIYISSATPIVNITVENTAASTSPDDRQLAVVSPAPVYELSGQVFCKAILGGSTRLKQAQLVFGTPAVMTSANGAMLWPIGVWDSSQPIVYQGSVSAADVDFQHVMDIPTTWNGGLVNLGFNPVKVVEDHLATWIQGGGSAADFLRQDDVFSVQIPVNLVGECVNTSSYGVHEYAGYTRRWVTANVFYRGDADIEDDLGPIIPMPDSITNLPQLPPQFWLHVPFAPVDRGDDDDSSDDPTDDDGSEPIFARFPIYDVGSSSYDGLWSGWVTYSGGRCPEYARPAVTPTGECVLVEACMPLEFGSCTALAGCCDAPLPAAPR